MKNISGICHFLLILATCLACDDGPTTVDTCGDNYLDPGEDCDGSAGGATCLSLGYYENLGTVTCTAGCRFDTSPCGAQCGDGTIDGDYGEDCDGTNVNQRDCQSLGSAGGTLACSADCQFDLTGCAGLCGNRLVEDGEDCDDGGNDAGDGCSPICEVEQGWSCSSGNPSLCAPICGDEMILGPEQCEPALFEGVTCEAEGYHPGEIACSEQCALDVSGCGGHCGDGEIQDAWETCDENDLAGVTCETLGFAFGGGMACDESCALDSTACLYIRSIAPGHISHTCAVLSDGTARCWGQNQQGQLGDDTFVNRNRPVPVVGLTGAVAITAGMAHTCALLDDRTVRCWGDNTSGQLGNGNNNNSRLPVTVSGLSDAVAVSAGDNFTCALRDSGGIVCWGENGSGQLGNGTLTSSNIPVGVSSDASFMKVDAGGSHVCALLITGLAACWGSDVSGKLGNGADGNQTTPDLLELRDVIDITAGGSHSCLVINSGYLYCWGAAGMVGNGTLTQQNSPVLLPGLDSVVAVRAGDQHTCALLSDGSMRCWGFNSQGPVGNGTTTNQISPVTVTGLTDAHFIGVGGFVSCSLHDQGKVARCWGQNLYGQLGDGTNDRRTTPVLVVP